MIGAAALRRQLEEDVRDSRERLIDLCARLVRVPSENPPGDTRPIVAALCEWLGSEPVQCTVHAAREAMPNLVVRVAGERPGRRLVFNGHLDTFPVGDPSLWTVDPVGGVVKDGRIYGRGVSDMKGGIAASVLALLLLARYREAWPGELVLTLAADEETMGPWGTKYLLDTVPEASGDAMICGDAGSPRVARFGEKGLVWLRVSARGRGAHGAHVHRGENAIESLMEALVRIRELRRLPVATPREVGEAIAAAAATSEAESGAGETEVLTTVTVNVGRIDGGLAVNLVPDRATAEIDIRLPVGVDTACIVERAQEAVANIPGVTIEVLRRFEPNYTSPSHEIVQRVVANGARVLGRAPVATMRVGASDSRYYRERGIPTVVYGPAPYNMGGADESITVDDLFAVGYVHVLTAFDFLAAELAAEP
jgi:succinyl-diaminopimelate desuccinylase